jgi:hypothetical protein
MTAGYFCHGCPMMVDVCVAHGTWFDHAKLEVALDAIERGARYEIPKPPVSRELTSREASLARLAPRQPIKLTPGKRGIEIQTIQTNPLPFLFMLVWMTAATLACASAVGAGHYVVIPAWIGAFLVLTDAASTVLTIERASDGALIAGRSSGWRRTTMLRLEPATVSRITTQTNAWQRTRSDVVAELHDGTRVVLAEGVRYPSQATAIADRLTLDLTLRLGP